MRKLFFLLLPIFCFGQWTDFRPTKIRLNNFDLAFTPVPSASDYQIEWKTIDDNDGLYVPNDDNWNTFAEYTESQYLDAVNGSTAVDGPAAYFATGAVYLWNLQANKKHRIRIRAFVSGSWGSWSYHLPVRTGLFPPEKIQYDEQNYVYRTPQAAMVFNTYTNEFGVTERRVSDRTRDGNDNRSSIPYPKVQRTYQYTDGGGFLRSFSTTSGIVAWDTETYQPVALPANTIQEFPSIIPTPRGTIRMWRNATNAADPNGSKFYEYINGTPRLIYDFTPFRGRVGSVAESMLRNGENRMSWDQRYVSFEYYKSNNFTRAYGAVFDMVTETVISEYDTNSLITGGVQIEEGQVTMGPLGLTVSYDTSAGSDDGFQYFTTTNTTPQVATGDQFEPENQGSSNANLKGSGHGDIGISIQGNEVWVGRRGGDLEMHILTGPNAGQTVDLAVDEIGGSGSANPEIGHITAQVYNNVGWAYVCHNASGGTPSGANRRFWRKSYAILLDESAEARGENSLKRVFARAQLGPPYTLSTASGAANMHKTPHGTPTRDGTKLFFNNYPPVGTSTLAGEVYVAQQTIPHGDEIPYTPDDGIGDPPVVYDPILKSILANQIFLIR